MMFGKKSNEDLLDEKEFGKIADRLDSDEGVVMSARQSRIKPGGAAVVTPNTIFLTQKRVIIRNPIRLGLGEHIEEYFYHQITNVRLEKGMLSSSLIFTIPGKTELANIDRSIKLWGHRGEGMIDAIPKKIAEKMYEYIRSRIAEEKAKKEKPQKPMQEQKQNPLDVLKMKFVNGEITEKEYEKMKKVLE